MPLVTLVPTGESFPAAREETILAAALGRSGTLRAPTLRIGERLYIGFGEGLYSQF